MGCASTARKTMVLGDPRVSLACGGPTEFKREISLKTGLLGNQTGRPVLPENQFKSAHNRPSINSTLLNRPKTDPGALRPSQFRVKLSVDTSR